MDHHFNPPQFSPFLNNTKRYAPIFPNKNPNFQNPNHNFNNSNTYIPPYPNPNKESRRTHFLFNPHPRPDPPTFTFLGPRTNPNPNPPPLIWDDPSRSRPHFPTLHQSNWENPNFNSRSRTPLPTTHQSNWETPNSNPFRSRTLLSNTHQSNWETSNFNSNGKRFRHDPDGRDFTLPTSQFHVESRISSWGQSQNLDHHQGKQPPPPPQNPNNYHHNHLHQEKQQQQQQRQPLNPNNHHHPFNSHLLTNFPSTSAIRLEESRNKSFFNASSSISFSNASSPIRQPPFAPKIENEVARDNGGLRVVSRAQFPPIPREGKNAVGNECVQDNVGLRVVSWARFPPIPSEGKNAVANECVQDIRRTAPKKKLQKTSASAKLQPAKPMRKMKDEQLVSSSYIVDSNSVAPKDKGLISMLDPDETDSKKKKKRRKIMIPVSGLDSLEVTGFQEKHVIDGTSCFEKELKQSEVIDLSKVGTSETGTVDGSQDSPNMVVSPNKSAIKKSDGVMVSIEDVINENHRKDDVMFVKDVIHSVHSDVDFTKESVVLDMQTPSPSGMEGDWQEAVAIGAKIDYHQESLEYEGKVQTEVASVAEHGNTIRDKCEDAVVSHSRMQEKLASSPLEVETQVLDRISPGSAMEELHHSNDVWVGAVASVVSNTNSNEEKLASLPLEVETQVLDRISPGSAIEGGGCNPLVKEELHPSNDVWVGAVASVVSNTNSDKEGLEQLPEGLSRVDAPNSFSVIPEVHILNGEQSFCHLSDERGCGGNNKSDEPPMNKDGIPFNTIDSSVSEPEVSEKSVQRIINGLVIPEKTLPLTSQKTRQSTTNPILNGGDLVRRTHQSSGIPRSFPRRASFTSGSSKEMTSTHTTRARTWRRTDASSPSPSASPIHESLLSSGALKRQSPKKFGKLQNASYIRRGNSLVRKSSHVLGPLVNQSNPISGNGIKNSIGTESKVDSVDCLPCSNAGGVNPFFERPKTPPLPLTAKLPNSTVDSSNSLSEPLSPHAISGPIKLTKGEDAPVFINASENLEIQSVLDDRNSKSSETKIMIYVKRKSNQLVAAHRSETHDPSVPTTDKTQPLPVIASRNGYYKRKRNQLIRSISSSRNQFKQAVTNPYGNSNSEGQRALKISSLKFSRSLHSGRLDKVLEKGSWVWTLDGTQSKKEGRTSLQRRNVLPYLFPWKRATYRRHFMSNVASVSNKSSLSLIRKLQLSRKMDAVYTRSTSGFSLRKSKVVSIGGSNLKWSKSIERRSKKASEEATLAVAAAERKKREQKGASCSVSNAKNGNRSSLKSSLGIELQPGERIFRVGSVRYKMDSCNRTLLRIPEEESSCAVDIQSGKRTRTSFVPRRLLIGNDEYIRIGNGNQLVRNPKKLIRILASEKIQRSLHTARLRLARKQQYCQFFTRFGKCKKDGGKCPYIHDPSKVAVCTKFLNGLCSSTNCKLTHKVIPERMQDCSYFLQGVCTNKNCPYRHVNVNPDASACEGFLRGYCADGEECRKKHTYVCPLFEAKGMCPKGPMCKLQHPKNGNKFRKQKRSKDQKNARGRYFGSSGLIGIGESATAASDHNSLGQSGGDIFFCEGRFMDYIGLDFDVGEGGETKDSMVSQLMLFNSDASTDLQSDDLDELIKPLRLMNSTKT
ncbi:uncharacterized protein LOC143889430 isoform X2 [Tasmannia lanceolata]|uniref:uncharacterized protein LOC143889430 isoform X2 n=1 Tax=Tasmannia lanceolata TaxID=3420 RepID=UPI0040641262